jgi:type VI secretion system FHA domain protein
MPLILTVTPIRGAGSRDTRTLTEGSLSIGRGPGNDWVLDDPDRQLSKTHCVISVEGSRYALTDLSTNGVYVNGGKDPTQRDSRTLLSDGDRLRLGDYTMTVTEVDIAPTPTARREDPFASPVAAPRADPFADMGDDPFGEPATMFKHPTVAKAVNLQRVADPFDRPEEGRGRPIDPLDADDDLFRGITPVQNWQGPSQADNADAPRQAFLAPKPIPPVNPNEIDFDSLLGDDPIGQFPAAAPVPPSRPVAPPPPPPPPPPQPMIDTLGFLDEDTIAPKPAAVRATPPAPLPTAPIPELAAATPPQPQAPTADAAALLEAFLQGAGIPDLKMSKQDPQQAMRAAGEVFRIMVEGLREVLMSRAAIKNELRVEQTMLRSRDNNALKFSVTPEEAVAALLMPIRAGYKPPVEAAKEAFRDIQSHELAVMAGVQTALVGLLKRFDPEALEARLQPGRLDSILPSARKARIWELFCATYKDIAVEAEDDFQSVFGREFAKAYDAQVRKL